MAQLPYITSPGNISRALNAIKQASVPDRVSQDFVKTKLNIPGGSGDQITAYLKKMGFSNTDGTPSELYKKFRNPTSSGQAIATVLKNTYAPLYVRNEYMHDLPDAGLIGLIVEETGHSQDSSQVKLPFACIKQLRSYAKFDSSVEIAVPAESPGDFNKSNNGRNFADSGRSLGLNLGYTINLNLPATTDPNVFDAIFRSLKQNLLSGDDV